MAVDVAKEDASLKQVGSALDAFGKCGETVAADQCCWQEGAVAAPVQSFDRDFKVHVGSHWRTEISRCDTVEPTAAPATSTSSGDTTPQTHAKKIPRNDNILSHGCVGAPGSTLSC